MNNDPQHGLNAQQIDARLQGGDRVNEPRDVDHFAYFRRYGLAKVAAEELTAAGFTVTVKRGLFQSTLSAVHHTAVDLSTANAFTSVVEHIVTKN